MTEARARSEKQKAERLNPLGFLLCMLYAVLIKIFAAHQIGYVFPVKDRYFHSVFF